MSNLTIQFRNITDSRDSVVFPMNSSDFSSAQTAGTVPSGMFMTQEATLGSPYSGSYSNARSMNFFQFIVNTQEPLALAITPLIQQVLHGAHPLIP